MKELEIKKEQVKAQLEFLGKTAPGYILLDPTLKKTIIEAEVEEIVNE